MRRVSVVALALAMAAAALLLCPVSALAGGTGSVSISASIGPCVRVTTGGEVLSNVSAFSLAEPDFLTIMAR